MFLSLKFEHNFLAGVMFLPVFVFLVLSQLQKSRRLKLAKHATVATYRKEQTNEISAA
jgi:hypothetical protein